MARVAIVYGALLILLGVVGYVATGAASPTALIPAFIGLPVALLGAWAARNPERKKHAMHIAVVLALLGLLGAARGIPGFFAMLAGEQVARPAAAVSQTLMVLLSAIFLTLAIRSFVQARRAG